MYRNDHKFSYSLFQILISLKTFMEDDVLPPIARSCFVQDDKHGVTSPMGSNRFWFKICHNLKTLDLIKSQSKVESVVALRSSILLFSQGLSDFLKRFYL